MKFAKFISMAACGMLAAVTWGQTTSSQPALPAGHPDITSATGGAQNNGLPAGHPDIGSTGPATRPAAKYGTLLLRVYQGTKDAPAIGAEPVVVELYHRGSALLRLEAKLDAGGTAVFQQLPLAMPFQPLVKITHSGVQYENAGELMDPLHSVQQIEMAVYEPTDQQPDWNVHIRHVIVDPKPDGLHVVEILAVLNPADRAWLGAASSDKKRTTVAIDLPAGAQKVDFAGGFQKTSTRIEGTRLISGGALPPGVSQFQLSYLVPAEKGQAKLNLVAPREVKHMMLLVTDNGATVNAGGLQASGSHDMGNGKVLVFGATDLKPGHQAAVTVTLPKSAKADAGSTPDAGGSDTAKAVAGVGAGLALTAGTAYVLLKPARPAKDKQTNRR